MELNKTTQDLKMEVETIKKSQSEASLKIDNLGKKSGSIDVSFTNRMQEMEERISGAEDSIENIGTTIKENTKRKRSSKIGHQEKVFAMSVQQPDLTPRAHVLVRVWKAGTCCEQSHVCRQ